MSHTHVIFAFVLLKCSTFTFKSLVSSGECSLFSMFTCSHWMFFYSTEFIMAGLYVKCVGLNYNNNTVVSPAFTLALKFYFASVCFIMCFNCVTALMCDYFFFWLYRDIEVPCFIVKCFIWIHVHYITPCALQKFLIFTVVFFFFSISFLFIFNGAPEAFVTQTLNCGVQARGERG